MFTALSLSLCINPSITSDRVMDICRSRGRCLVAAMKDRCEVETHNFASHETKSFEFPDEYICENIDDILTI